MSSPHFSAKKKKKKKREIKCNGLVSLFILSFGLKFSYVTNFLKILKISVLGRLTSGKLTTWKILKISSCCICYFFKYILFIIVNTMYFLFTKTFVTCKKKKKVFMQNNECSDNQTDATLFFQKGFCWK